MHNSCKITVPHRTLCVTVFCSFFCKLKFSSFCLLDLHNFRWRIKQINPKKRFRIAIRGLSIATPWWAKTGFGPDIKSRARVFSFIVSLPQEHCCRFCWLVDMNHFLVGRRFSQHREILVWKIRPSQLFTPLGLLIVSWPNCTGVQWRYCLRMFTINSLCSWYWGDACYFEIPLSSLLVK